jgi:hypothetical protein
MLWLNNTACAAGLDSEVRKEVEVKAIMSLQQNGRGGRSSYGGGLTTEERIEFLDILINHTPYGKCIVNKDPVWADKVGLIVDPNFGYNLVLGALIAHRLLWEYADIAKDIIHYAKLTGSKPLAFMLGHAYTAGGDERGGRGHICLDNEYLSKSHIKNFITGDGTVVETYAVKKGYDYTIDKMWGVSRDQPIQEEIREFASSGEVSSIPNPFAKTLVLDKAAASDAGICEYFKVNLDKIVGGQYE